MFGCGPLKVCFINDKYTPTNYTEKEGNKEDCYFLSTVTTPFSNFIVQGG